MKTNETVGLADRKSAPEKLSTMSEDVALRRIRRKKIDDVLAFVMQDLPSERIQLEVIKSKNSRLIWAMLGAHLNARLSQAAEIELVRYKNQALLELYTADKPLCNEAENVLVTEVSQFLKSYASRHKLNQDAEVALVKSADAELINFYFVRYPFYSKAEVFLIQRGAVDLVRTYILSVNRLSRQAEVELFKRFNSADEETILHEYVKAVAKWVQLQKDEDDV